MANVNFQDSEGWRDSKPANKMPRIDLSFWCALLLAAAAGSALLAMLTETLGLGCTLAAVVLGVIAFNLLVVQVRAIVHIHSVFWVTTAALSACASLAAGMIAPRLALEQFHIVALAVMLLGATLASWHMSERLSPRRVTFVAQREVYYWLATLLAFMLGAALCELLMRAATFSLAETVLIFGTCFLVMVLVHMAVPQLALPAFWLACACAWSFGNAMVHLIAHPIIQGGFGFGAVPTSALFIAAMSAMVMHLARARNEQFYMSRF